MRPGDAIDRIDAIDEVGRGYVQCTMHNAQCTMGEGAALEDDETTRRRDDEQSGLAFAKRLEARSCRLVSPSSRRPVVVGAAQRRAGLEQLAQEGSG